MGGTGCGENRSLALVGRAMLSKIIKSNFLPMDGAVLPPYWLFDLGRPSSGVYRLCGRARGDLQKDLCQHAPPRTAAASAPVSAIGHCQPTPLQETFKHSQTCLAQSLVGSVLLSPASWCAQGLFVPSKSLCFPKSCGSSVIKSR